jgi:hypothetical protein
MLENNILIDFRLSKSKLNLYLQEAIDQYKDTKISAGDFEIILINDSNQQIKLEARQKSVFAKIPIAFTFAKKAGLFSIEGEGSIQTHLEIICDIDHNFGLKTTTILHGYEWDKGPVLHVGQLNIPVETLSNCVINFLKESMMEKLDKRLAETADIKTAINDQLKQYATNYPVYKKPDLFFNGQLLQVQSGLFREDEHDIHIDMWLELSGKITDEPLKFVIDSEPVFYWLESIPVKSNQIIDIELSYPGLSKMIMTAINGQEIGGKTFELESINIRNTNQLEIKAHMTDPIKGIITITCEPYLDKEAQMLNLKSFNIDIDASNIIYKLSSPIIEKLISNKISTLLPFDPSPYIKGFLAKPPQISLLENKISLIPSYTRILIESLHFTANGIASSIALEDAELDVVV